MPLEHDRSLAQFLDLEAEDQAAAKPVQPGVAAPPPAAAARPTGEKREPSQLGERQTMALAFLGMLEADAFEFRCIFDDKGAEHKPPTQQIRGTFAERGHALKALNEQGYGIFVQVNGSDGKGNKSANVTRAPCHFVDLDGAPLANVERLGVKPTAVYETSPGKWHAYWRVDDIRLADYKTVQQRLAALCESDKSVVDLARVMRLPGFHHQKNPSEPFLVQRVGGCGAVVARDAFMAALDAAEAARGIGKKAGGKQSGGLGNVAAAGRASDIRRAEEMLRFLIEAGKLDVADYPEWRNVGFALKASYGDAGWPLFLALSQADTSFDGEEACHKVWKSGGDASDGRNITIASFFARAKEAGFIPAAGSGGGGAAGGRGGKSKDHAIDVLAQAEDAGDEHFVDQHGEPHAAFRPGHDGRGARLCAPIGSDLYADALRLRFLKHTETKMLPREALNNAVDTFKARARQAQRRQRVELRVGSHDGAIYVDLGRPDGKQVRVDADGIEVVDDGPVRFVSGGRGELPLPDLSGTLDDLARQMPNLDGTDVRRVAGFLINVFNPHGTCPLLSIAAGAGSGKTFTADKLLGIVDPPADRATAHLSFPRKEDDLIVQGRAAHVLLYDNVSSITPDQADWLCKVASGAGLTKRTLFSDGTPYIVSVRRPVIVTSIGLASDRGDLLDRTISVSPQAIEMLVPEEELWASFEADRAKLLGFVLNGVSAALRNRNRIRELEAEGVIKLPRLSDFSRFVEGAHEVLGLAPGAFSTMLREAQNSLKGEAAAGDPLGAAIVRALSNDRTTVIEGAAVEIRDRLGGGPDDERRALPHTNKIRQALVRIEPGLRDLGIDVAFTSPRGKAKVWRIRIAATPAFTPIEWKGDF